MVFPDDNAPVSLTNPCGWELSGSKLNPPERLLPELNQRLAKAASANNLRQCVSRGSRHN